MSAYFHCRKGLALLKAGCLTPVVLGASRSLRAELGGLLGRVQNRFPSVGPVLNPVLDDVEDYRRSLQRNLQVTCSSRFLMTVPLFSDPQKGGSIVFASLQASQAPRLVPSTVAYEPAPFLPAPSSEALSSGEARAEGEAPQPQAPSFSVVPSYPSYPKFGLASIGSKSAKGSARSVKAVEFALNPFSMSYSESNIREALRPILRNFRYVSFQYWNRAGKLEVKFPLSRRPMELNPLDEYQRAAPSQAYLTQVGWKLNLRLPQLPRWMAPAIRFGAETRIFSVRPAGEGERAPSFLLREILEFYFLKRLFFFRMRTNFFNPLGGFSELVSNNFLTPQFECGLNLHLNSGFEVPSEFLQI